MAAAAFGAIGTNFHSSLHVGDAFHRFSLFAAVVFAGATNLAQHMGLLKCPW
jgi:hypothetical protein